jgi:hypothetical protein
VIYFRLSDFATSLLQILRDLGEKEHDAILRDVIDKRHGHLFKHTGDGVCAAFASPKSAVDDRYQNSKGPARPRRIPRSEG